MRRYMHLGLESTAIGVHASQVVKSTSLPASQHQGLAAEVHIQQRAESRQLSWEHSGAGVQKSALVLSRVCRWCGGELTESRTKFNTWASQQQQVLDSAHLVCESDP